MKHLYNPLEVTPLFQNLSDSSFLTVSPTSLAAKILSKTMRGPPHRDSSEQYPFTAINRRDGAVGGVIGCQFQKAPFRVFQWVICEASNAKKAFKKMSTGKSCAEKYSIFSYTFVQSVEHF